MANPELSNLDLSKVAALQQKRTLAFVNHFASTNVQFLNSFMKKCEHKLMQFERKLEKVEAAMVLLESRLSSIPEVKTITSASEKKESQHIQVPTEQDVTPLDNISKETTNKEQTTEETVKTEVESKIDTPDNPVQIPAEYLRFVKMVQVGVPVDAVKLKVSIEGLDPDILVKVLGK